ncbi:MAG: glycoside hydrolase family 13 protein [Clostridia bacterium]|nr:glycoside hydrolase family 13 protein [Clostridia bacterium]
MAFLYNPLCKTYNKKGGTIKVGESLTITVKTDYAYSNLILKSDKDSETAVYPMSGVDGEFSVTLKNLKKGLYFYHFESGGKIFGKGDNLDAKLDSDSYQLIVYDRNYTVPAWLKGGFIYQIFPDRFCKGKDIKISGKIMRKWGEEPYYLPDADGKIKNNDFFGGNFKGIEKKLPYLKNLGVTAIYLNPIALSYSNHRYDTADYLTIDPLLGGEKDLVSLIKKAHDYGIKLIFDGVYNHTGDDSVYFNKYNTFDSVGAYQSKNSKYYTWYTFQKYPNKYTSWWGINVLPTINKNSKEFEDFILNKVLPYYFNLGFDGIRLDVVDEIPTPFVKKIRKVVKKLNANAVIIGEVWEDATNKIAYGNRREYFLGNELDSVMNYPLKSAIINALTQGDVNGLITTIKEQVNNYPKPALSVLMNILGTHDTARILTVLSGVDIPSDRESASKLTLTKTQKAIAEERLLCAYTILFTLYGVPTVYYGDEVLLSGAKDPFNRRCMDFSLPKGKVYNLIKKLSKIRKENPVFSQGETVVDNLQNGVLRYKRTLGDEEIDVIVNLSNYEYDVTLSGYDELLTNTKKKEYTLKKYKALILKRRIL